MISVCDFRQSFFHFEIDLEKQSAITVSHKMPSTMNHVRIPLECRCLVTDTKAGGSTEYVLGASCKTEKVKVDRDVWLQPNANFCPVVSKEDFLNIKSWDRCDKGVMLYPPSLGAQPERQIGKASEAWCLHQIDVKLIEGRVLETTEQVVEAVSENRRLLSHTEFEIEGGCRVLLEYPVKTVNINDRDNYYQVDTGPVLFPDMTMGNDNLIGNFRLAYVAHNSPDWAEFIVNVPTPLSEEISVNHYSKSVRVVAQNKMIELS